MNRNFKAIWLRNFTAACLALAIFTTSSMVALATPENKPLMGEITVSGVRTNGIAPFVMLNGENAFNGRTFFSTGTIVTPADVNSTINLGKVGSVTLSPNTTLNLSFDDKTVSGTLSAGQIRVSNAEGVAVKIQTNAGLVANKANAAGTFEASANSAARKDDDDANGGGSSLGPLLVLGGIVAAVVIVVFVSQRGDDTGDISVSPLR